MAEVFNTLYEEFSSDPETGQLVLRNRLDQRLVQLSRTELKLLVSAEDKSRMKSVVSEVKVEYPDLSMADIRELLDKGREAGLIIEEMELIDGLNKLKKKKSKNGILFILMLYFQNFIRKLTGLNILIELSGGFRLFKIWSVKIDGTRLEEWSEKPFVRNLFYGIWVFATVAAIYLVITGLATAPAFGEILMLSSINLPTVFILLLAGIALSYFFHEWAHYLVYKHLRGGSGKMGFAFMYYLIPVCYTTVDTVYFWNDRKRKIKVSLAGILMDFTLTLSIGALYVMSAAAYPGIGFTLFLLLLFVGIRLVSNLNLFMPGTDAYYILIDWIRHENFFEDAWKNVRQTYRLLTSLDIRAAAENFRQYWVMHSYYHVALLFITAYWIMIFAIIYFPFFIYFEVLLF